MPSDVKDELLKSVVSQVRTRGAAATAKERGIKFTSVRQYMTEARRRGLAPPDSPVSDVVLKRLLLDVALEGPEAAAKKRKCSLQKVRQLMAAAVARGLEPGGVPPARPTSGAIPDATLQEVVNQVNTRGMASVLRERGLKPRTLQKYLSDAQNRGIVPRGGRRGAEPPKPVKPAADAGAAPELKWQWDGNAWVPAAAASPASPVPVARQSHMRRFVLERSEDLTGTSGVGVVAEGVVFSNGHVAYSWISPLATITTCQSIDVVERLHGHDGRTVVRFLEGK